MLEVILTITKLMSPRSPVKIDETLVPVLKLVKKAQVRTTKYQVLEFFGRCDVIVPFSQSFGM